MPLSSETHFTYSTPAILIGAAPTNLTGIDFCKADWPIFSADGLTIIFTSERDGNKEIYSYNIESKKISNLSRNKGDDWNARFYNDSEKLIFQSTRDGNWEVYRMALDGSNQVNLTNHPSTDYSYVVLPLLNP